MTILFVVSSLQTSLPTFKFLIHQIHRGPIFEKSYDEFTIVKVMTILRRSYDDFMILGYDKVYNHKFTVIKFTYLNCGYVTHYVFLCFAGSENVLFT